MKYKLHDPPRLQGKYLSGVLSSGWLTTGPECMKLREALAKRFCLPASRIVLASSATAAFQGVLDCILGRSDYVRITEATWPGMRQAVLHAGGECVHGDAEVVVRTDIGGARCDDRPCPAGARYVHDACHSWLPDPAADFAIASAYPTKLVPGAEGGVVFCAREEDACTLEAHLYCGLRPGGAGEGEEPAVCGRKANMTDVAAALNREALEQFDDYAAAIRESWEWLRLEAAKRGVPYRDQPVRRYLFQVECRPSEVPTFRSRLREVGIPSAWNFRPSGLITLPCGPHVGPKEARDILETVSRLSNPTPAPSPR